MILGGGTMKSQERACGKKRKIIMVPYPAQGHVTPMIQLAYAFQSQGFDPILVTPEFIHRKIAPKINPAGGFSCMSVPDGLDRDPSRDFFAIEQAMENTMPVHLDRLVRKILEEEKGSGIACIVVDLLASWAIRVADECGVRVAGYWPVMLGAYQVIASIPDLVLSGMVSNSGNPQIKGPICILPDKTVLSAEDLPWLIGNSTARALRFKFWNRTLLRTMSLKWILVNSQPEPQCQNQQPSAHPNILPVGPLIKHMVCKTASSSFWEEDMTCLDWLDKKKPSSVIYVSFGSWVSPIGEGKIRSLALALESVGRPFLWVLGHSWLEGLPKGFEERVGARGKVVPWAPQLEVLKHEAVGCYLTHCGWNSTVEAVNCLKPMVCYPVAGDQFVNCAYIVGVWRIGVRVCGFGQKEVEDGLKQAMEDGGMKERLERAKEEIMGKEASSAAARNLMAFIDDLDNDVQDLMDYGSFLEIIECTNHYEVHGSDGDGDIQ